MISWIQKYFHKHFRLVFFIILVAVGLPMVVIYSQSSGLGQADGRQSRERLFFGLNLSSEQEGGRLMRDGSYSAQLRGANQLEDGMIEQFALSRVAGLALADELHLPNPSQTEIAAHIATLPAFQDQQGNFDQKRYTNFADSLKANPQFTTADANRIFRDDTRIEILHKLLGGPGYVLPGDVREMLNRTDAKWSVGLATLDYASFDAGVTVTDEALKKYFDENTFRYEVAPRAKLSSVEFKSLEFVPPGALPEEQLRAYYNTNLTRFPAPADPASKDATTPALGGDNFSKVRPQVESALRIELATRAAVKAANDFTVALYDSKATANSSDLAAFLAKQKRTAVGVEPFSPDAPPATMPWMSYYGEQISRLNKDRFFSEPLQTPDGAIVLLWNDVLPSYQPTLAQVREKVAADYTANEKRKRFVAQGQMLRAKLAAAVKAGTTFEKAAADSKLEVKSYASFTLQDSPKDLPSGARSALQSLKLGEVSEMISTGEKGYLVYAAQKQAPDLTPANPRFAEIRSRLMAYNSSSTGNAIIGNLVKTELEKTAPPSAGPTTK